MKIRLTKILFLLFFTNIFGQTNDRVYLYHGKSGDSLNRYVVDETTIHSDSTFTTKIYYISRKEWEEYKKIKPEISKGKIIRKNNYYVMAEYRNGIKTDYFWNLNILDDKLIFYFSNKRDKLKKSETYYRIEK